MNPFSEHLSPNRYMLFHWPLLSAAIGTTLNMCLLSFMALLSWYQIYYSRGNGNSFEYEPDRKPKDRSEMEERRKNIREMLAKERKGKYSAKSFWSTMLSTNPYVGSGVDQKPMACNSQIIRHDSVCIFKD